MSSSLGRGVPSNLRLFALLLSVIAVGGLVMKVLQAVVADSGSIQAGIFVAMAIVAACYVGLTHGE